MCDVLSETFFTSGEDRKLVYDVNGSEVDLLASRFSGPSYVLPD